MRLTNVTHMSLPPGLLRSYSMAVIGARDRPLPVSFDQGRHVGLGDRPASWMAIAFRAPAGTTTEQLGDGWDDLVARHGTLRTVFTQDDAGQVALMDGIAEHGIWEDHDIAPGQTSRERVRVLFDTACRSLSSPSHRLAVLTPDAGDGAAGPGDPRPVVIIGSDHAHVDMWSLLVLARDLLELVEPAEEGTDGTGTGARFRGSVATFNEHTALLEAAPPAPAEVHDAWRAILDAGEGVMPRFPLSLGDVSAPRPEVVEVHDVLDAEQLHLLNEHADEAKVRVTALALSVLTRVSLDVAGGPLRAVFPVHSRYEPRWHDSVGWFITNSVIECVDPDPRECAASVKRALALGSYPLAPILAPWGGMPQSPGMFAISWLDVRRIPISVDPRADVQWVSAAIETDGVMIWFVVSDAGMHMRCRYPDTPEARENVGGWIVAVIAEMREAARARPAALGLEATVAPATPARG